MPFVLIFIIQEAEEKIHPFRMKAADVPRCILREKTVKFTEHPAGKADYLLGTYLDSIDLVC